MTGKPLNQSKLDGLTDKQRRAIPIFASARSITEACRILQIQKDCYYRWIRNESFRAALEENRRVIFEETTADLKRSCLQAVDTLNSLLLSENEAIRRAAASDILGHAFRYREADLEARIFAIEKKMQEEKNESK